MKKETRIELKKALAQKGMSEQQLADLMGCTRQHLNNISCGRANPTVEQLERIAEGLGMTLQICFK